MHRKPLNSWNTTSLDRNTSHLQLKFFSQSIASLPDPIYYFVVVLVQFCVPLYTHA